MESGKPSGQTSSLDSLRTVEFRQTLRGYHIDDVDEYLERVAVDAEALQEQMRQAGERLKQAAERIAQVEGMLQETQQQPAGAGPGPAVSDDTLQRTLVLAQKFVDQTQSDAETQARILVAEAEDRARKLLGEAELRAKTVTEDTERHLREEIARLESLRSQLAGDVETIARHMENERNRLRAALGDMLSWVDEHVQPAASLLAPRPAARPAPRAEEAPAAPPVEEAPAVPGSDAVVATARADEMIPTTAAPDTGDASGAEPSGMTLEGGGRTSVPVQGNAATGGAHPVGLDGVAPDADRQGVMPIDGSSQPQAIAPR